MIELAIGNIVRRVLKVTREVARGEFESADAENGDDDSEEYSDSSSDDDFAHQKTSTKKSNKNNNNPKIQVTELFLQPNSSMFNLLSDAPSTPKSEELQIKNTYNLKPLIIQEINEEIIADLESVYKGIADQATDFIHAK